MGKKYSTYVLELVRNSGIIAPRSGENEKYENEYNNYFIFDYFDALHCKKLTGKDKKYINYLSIVNVFEEEIENKINNNMDCRVAHKTLSLYCKSETDMENSERENADFFSIQSEGTTLSNTPFLGIIQISLCMDSYELSNQQNIEHIDTFLEECESHILEVADASKPAEEEIQMRRALFRSSTTGDFCLVIRTNLIRLIYDIAIKLNGTQNDPDQRYTFLTYTNVGIECKYTAEKGYATLNQDVVRKNSEKIALRFSADESIRGELQQYIKKVGQAKVEGLFGRYEYLLTIGMDEFASLYPYLCECKLGKKRVRKKESPLEAILNKTLARNINERILIQLESNGAKIASDTTKKKEAKEKEEKEVFAKNKCLLERIDEINKSKIVFQEEHFAFQDLIRGMIEIYNSFSAVGMDKESYVNWRIFHRDMKVLCNCILQMINYYKQWTKIKCVGELEKKRYRGAVLRDWRENLNAINRYMTQVQNINYQTYQSPSYEIQTSIDAEKFMVAYREFMELYITDAMKASKEEMGENFRVYPIIYPNLSKEKVAVTAPFMVKKPIKEMNAREIICTVPSFEYFARLYDLLPWIIHETSHHLRVIDRKIRNEFVMDYILSYIFKVLMRKKLRRLSDYDLYEAYYGEIEKYLVVCMTDEAKKEICKSEDLKKHNFEMLLLEIDKWLTDMFPLGAGYDEPPLLDEEKNLREHVFRFWLDAYRKEDILTQENLNIILSIWDNKISVTEKEILANNLLAKYYRDLQEKLPDKAQGFKICLEDMYRETTMEEKLARLADESENGRTPIRKYYEQILAVYRIMKISFVGKYDTQKKPVEYFHNVFRHYKENYEKEIIKRNIMVNAASMHMMRNLGLLREDSEDFNKEMIKIFRNISNAYIMEHKEIKQKIYLETYADILMATSLQLTSFGYCRQVLQTASDAKLTEKEYQYKDINYERWRTVAAVLLVTSDDNKGSETGEWLEVDARQLIKDAQEYCKYVIIHIYKKFSEEKTIKIDGETYEKSENDLQLFRELLELIYTQMKLYLAEGEDQISGVMLLDILLHETEEDTDPKVMQTWNAYKKVARLCDDFRYNFWRLACFCKGIVNIAKDEKIIVSAKLFHHMWNIRNEVNGGNGIGCKWEGNRNILTNAKQDVGAFYNDPAQVYEKTPDLKLENTIEFIQNYYYYNRFRVKNMFDTE